MDSTVLPPAVGWLSGSELSSHSVLEDLDWSRFSHPQSAAIARSAAQDSSPAPANSTAQSTAPAFTGSLAYATPAPDGQRTTHPKKKKQRSRGTSNPPSGFSIARMGADKLDVRISADVPYDLDTAGRAGSAVHGADAADTEDDGMAWYTPQCTDSRRSTEERGARHRDASRPRLKSESSRNMSDDGDRSFAEKLSMFSQKR